VLACLSFLLFPLSFSRCVFQASCGCVGVCFCAAAAAAASASGLVPPTCYLRLTGLSCSLHLSVCVLCCPNRCSMLDAHLTTRLLYSDPAVEERHLSGTNGTGRGRGSGGHARQRYRRWQEAAAQRRPISAQGEGRGRRTFRGDGRKSRIPAAFSVLHETVRACSETAASARLLRPSPNCLFLLTLTLTLNPYFFSFLSRFFQRDDYAERVLALTGILSSVAKHHIANARGRRRVHAGITSLCLLQRFLSHSPLPCWLIVGGCGRVWPASHTGGCLTVFYCLTQRQSVNLFTYPPTALVLSCILSCPRAVSVWG